MYYIIWYRMIYFDILSYDISSIDLILYRIIRYSIILSDNVSYDMIHFCFMLYILYHNCCIIWYFIIFAPLIWTKTRAFFPHPVSTPFITAFITPIITPFRKTFALFYRNTSDFFLVFCAYLRSKLWGNDLNISV